MSATIASSVPAPRGRYTGVAMALHWLTAVVLALTIPTIWLAETVPEGPSKVWWYMLHHSVGIAIFGLVVARLTWRAAHPPPAMPGGEPAALRLLARISHWTLYAVLIVMPVSGYVMTANGHSVAFLDLFDLPGYAKNDAVGKAANQVHLVAQYVVYVLVALHVAGTAWHVAVRRDGTLDRMLPAQDRAPPAP